LLLFLLPDLGKAGPFTVVVAKWKMKKFPQKRARGGFVTVVLAEGKSFAKPPFSHSAERTADERN